MAGLSCGGALAPGAFADIIMLDYHPYTPLTDANHAWHLVFGMDGSHVTHTLYRRPCPPAGAGDLAACTGDLSMYQWKCSRCGAPYAPEAIRYACPRCGDAAYLDMLPDYEAI